MKQTPETTVAKEILATHVESLRLQVEMLMAATLMENKLKLDKLSSELKFKDVALKFKNTIPEKTDIEMEKSFLFPSNREILGAVEIVQPYIVEYYNDMNTLRNWLDLQKRKLKTGNGFPLAVVETLSKEVSITIRGLGVQDYLVTRAKLVGKAVKYPQSEDAINAVVSLDYVFKLGLGRSIDLFAQSYAEIYNIMSKNWDTITAAEREEDNPMY